MNIKILLASFGLVFLAELGDKTQLTALAFSASSRSPWSVFIGTSLALVASSAIAVLCGEMLARVVPEKVLHISSGVAFVLIGVILLVNVARKAPAKTEDAPKEEAAGPVMGSAISAFVLRQAVCFEEELVAELEEHAAKASDDETKQIAGALAQEHRGHIESLTKASDTLGTGDLAADGEDEPDAESVRLADVLKADMTYAQDGEALLNTIVRKQEAAAELYLALAKIARIHEVRDTFRWLAMEEIRHAHALCDHVNKPDTTTV